ncbi:SDR family oxidoreductase [Caballeronia sp. J97]|uniref:SDR family NAD(P)-dependent oxidoreductase n=1 Tax=Caballeronia sp. J97 TaxID=2805429 RepID=UPI002AAF3686|nr:SDR family oxidoreductase [Caballeronia sp. J97]
MLFGKTALITGGGGGLGIGIAKVLAEQGARIVVLDMTAEACQHACDALLAEGLDPSDGVQIDVSSADSVARAFVEVDRLVDRIDILVNCAGVREVSSVFELSAAEWDRVIAINLSGPFYCAREAALRMRESRGGSIVNISSVAAMLGMPHRPAYNASKAGLMGLTRNLAKDLAPWKIRVNAVAPGLLRTPLTEPYFDDPAFERGLDHVVPLGKGGTPRDVGQAVLYLSSPMAEFVTGIMLPVDGGWSSEKGYTVGDGPSPYTSSTSST